MYPILTLKQGRDRSVIHRHPWIFSGGVKHLPDARNGDIVQVQDDEGKPLAYGFFSPQNQIVCRLFEFGAGPVRFDGPDYWHRKIRTAHALRKAHLLGPHTDACRLLHAEGDFLPGVIADLYGDLAVVQLLVKGSEGIAPHIVSGLQQVGVRHVYLKNKHNPGFREDVGLPNGFLTAAPPAEALTIMENGLRFRVDYEKGQKTGFFLDQRENRALLRQYAAGKRVLNAFSYTGGFSVYALAGGAADVHSVDVSKEAVQGAEENVRLNFDGAAPHRAIVADCFDYLKETTEAYDVAVLDPPAFAKNAKSVPNAARGYKELNLKAFRKISPGGVVFTFSCSQNIDRDLFRKIIFGAAADAGRNVRILHQLSQPQDHPINIYHPEGEYLKGLVLHVE